VAVFGRFTHARSDIYENLPEWQALIADPTPQKAAAAGYSYMYWDQASWNAADASVQQAYRQPCVRLVDEVSQDTNIIWRRLYEVKDCQ
jgi:hypothetical protein